MAASLVAVAPCFKITDLKTRTVVVAVLTIVVFTFFYSIGAGPVPFTLSAEVFPLAYRGEPCLLRNQSRMLKFFSEVGMSVSVMVNFMGLGLLVLFVPQLTDVFGGRASDCADEKQGRIASLTGQARLMGLFAYEILLLPMVPNHKLTRYKRLERPRIHARVPPGQSP